MREASFRGGATVGWVHASWPFAKLAVSSDRLTLDCLGRYAFAPGDVEAVEIGGVAQPRLGCVRIRHNRHDYPKTMEFACVGGPQRVMTAIAATGFVPRGAPLERPQGLAIRWQVIVLAIAAWNALFFAGMSLRGHHAVAGPLLATLFLFLLATAMRSSARVQRWTLAEGRQVGELGSSLTLLQCIGGLLSLAFAVVLFAA